MLGQDHPELRSTARTRPRARPARAHSCLRDTELEAPANQDSPQNLRSHCSATLQLLLPWQRGPVPRVVIPRVTGAARASTAWGTPLQACKVLLWFLTCLESR